MHVWHFFSKGQACQKVKTMSAAPPQSSLTQQTLATGLKAGGLVGSCKRRWLQPLLGSFSAVQCSVKQQIEEN